MLGFNFRRLLGRDDSPGVPRLVRLLASLQLLDRKRCELAVMWQAADGATGYRPSHRHAGKKWSTDKVIYYTLSTAQRPEAPTRPGRGSGGDMRSHVNDGCHSNIIRSTTTRLTFIRDKGDPLTAPRSLAQEEICVHTSTHQHSLTGRGLSSPHVQDGATTSVLKSEFIIELLMKLGGEMLHLPGKVRSF